MDNCTTNRSRGVRGDDHSRKRGRQRPFVRLLVTPGAILLLLAGCGVSTGPGTLSGTLVGQVIASPTCPVEPVARSCSPAPVPHRRVAIDAPDGKLVETATTDSGGHFSATLPVGSYVLRVAIQPGTIGMRQITPGNITITAGHTTVMTIDLDTGIR